MSEELKDALCEIFEIDEVKETDNLRDYEMWDSLAGLSIISLCDAKYGFTLSAATLKTLITVSDLAQYIVANKTK